MTTKKIPVPAAVIESGNTPTTDPERFDANYTRAEDVAGLRVVAADVESTQCVCAPGSITGRDGLVIVLVDGHAVLQDRA